MKISFRYPARVLTGYLHSHSYLSDANQRYQLGSVRESMTPLYAVRLKTAVVFDRELFIARRLKAAGRLALLTTALVTVTPLFIVQGVAKLTEKAVDWAAEKIGDGLEAVGAIPGWNLGQHYGQLIRDLTK